MALAAERSGRTAKDVKLVAVSKRQDADKIISAAACGQTTFGENYLQEAQEKITNLSNTYCWHFIGHLQSNKAKVAAELFDVIETVDRIKIARALDRHANGLNKKLQIFIQVNIGREKQKNGVLPEETEELLKTVRAETTLHISGLMGIAPRTNDPESSRYYFRKLRELSEQLTDKGLFSSSKNVELSMGMSADYPIAIEEGATLVRVGTALFGQRKE